MSDSRRDDIIAVTKNLLWEVGYESMSPRMVMDASGAGQGSLYHHFRGKKALAVVALEEIEREMRADIDAIFDRDIPAIDKLRTYLSMKREGTKGCRLGRLATEHSIADDEIREPVARYFTYVESRLRACIAEAARDGALRAGLEPGQLAASLVAAVQGGFLLSRIHGDSKHMVLATGGLLHLLS